MNQNTEPFKVYECRISKIIFEPEQSYIVSLMVEDEEYGVFLMGQDGSILTFVDSGCAAKAHINTIHQVFLRFKQDCGFALKKVVIEAKYGDVIYCRLNWEKDGKDLFNVIGIGDALILHSLTQCPLYVTQFVLDQFEPFNSDGYMKIFEGEE